MPRRASGTGNQSISVCIQRVIYRSIKTQHDRHNGYTLFECTILTEPDQTVFVDLPRSNQRLLAGHFVKFIGCGQDTEHPELYHASSCEIITDSEIIESTRYALQKLKLDWLSTDDMIGRVLDYFGTDTPAMIQQPNELLKVFPHLSFNEACAPAMTWKYIYDLAKDTQQLRDYGIPAYACYYVWKHPDAEMMYKVLDNPYLLQEKLHIMRFTDIDEIVRASMGIQKDNINRVRCLIIDLMYNTSDTYVRDKKIREHEKIREIVASAVNSALQMLLDEKILTKFSDEEGIGYQLMELNRAERNISDIVSSMSTSKCDTLYVDLDMINRMLLPTSLDEEQQKAVLAAATNQLVLLTGCAGTGKTTTVKAIYQMFRNNGLEVALAAPTGRAARRLQEKTLADAVTIHSLLGGKRGADSFDHNAENKLDIGALILDECSMIDTRLMNAVLNAIRPTTRLVLVGDYYQLQPVDKGCPFKEMIFARVKTRVDLSVNHRQGDGIIDFATDVRTHERPEMNRYGGKCVLIKADTKREIVNSLMSTLAEMINAGVDTKKIMILCKQHSSLIGTNEINTLLQNKFNHSGKALFTSRDGTEFRMGDRVMALQNRYDRSDQPIFNGYIGTIIDYKPAGIDDFFGTEVPAKVTVHFPDARCDMEYTQDEVGFDEGQLDLAYCSTVHKSQGNEFDTVIFLFGDTLGAHQQLDRQMFYTAVTRAKNNVIMIGSESTFYRALDNKSHRNTRLRFRLKKQQKKSSSKKGGN